MLCSILAVDQRTVCTCSYSRWGTSLRTEVKMSFKEIRNKDVLFQTRFLNIYCIYRLYE